jgi:hypothetical protein
MIIYCNSHFAEGSGEYKKQDRAPTPDVGSRTMVRANLVFARQGNAKMNSRIFHFIK